MIDEMIKMLKDEDEVQDVTYIELQKTKQLKCYAAMLKKENGELNFYINMVIDENEKMQEEIKYLQSNMPRDIKTYETYLKNKWD